MDIPSALFILVVIFIFAALIAAPVMRILQWYGSARARQLELVLPSYSVGGPNRTGHALPEIDSACCAPDSTPLPVQYNHFGDVKMAESCNAQSFASDTSYSCPSSSDYSGGSSSSDSGSSSCGGGCD